MAPLFKLSPDETLRLVQEYKKHDLLYNKNHELYKNTMARRSALQFIGDVLQLNKSVNEINRKLKSLRSTFILEQNKILQDTEYIPKLIWYNEMASFVNFTPTGKSGICTDEQSIGVQLPPKHEATTRCLKRLTVSRRRRGPPRKCAKRTVMPPMSVLLEAASTSQASQHHAASCHKAVRFEEPGNTAVDKGVSESSNTSFAANIQSQRSSIDRVSEPEREATSQTSQTVPEYKILIKFAEFINATLRALDINVFLVAKSAIQQILNDHRLINLKEQDINEASKQVLNQSMATELSRNDKAKVSFKALLNNDDEYDAFTYEMLHQLILMSKWSYLHAQTQIVSIIVTMRLNPWICKQSDSDLLVRVRDLMMKVHGQLQENDIFKAKLSKKRVVLREPINSKEQGILDAESATPGEAHQERRSREGIVRMEQSNSREQGILDAESATPGEALYQEGRSREGIVPMEQSISRVQGILDAESATPDEAHQKGRSREGIVPMEQSISRVQGILDAESATPDEAHQKGRSREVIVPMEQSNSREQGILDAESASPGEALYQEGRSREGIVRMEQSNSREQGILDAESATPGEALYQEGRSRKGIVPKEQSTTSNGILFQEVNTEGYNTPPGTLSNIRTPQLYSPFADFEFYNL